MAQPRDDRTSGRTARLRADAAEAFVDVRPLHTTRWPRVVRWLWPVWPVVPAAIIFGTGLASLDRWLTVAGPSTLIVAAVLTLPILLVPRLPAVA